MQRRYADCALTASLLAVITFALALAPLVGCTTVTYQPCDPCTPITEAAVRGDLLRMKALVTTAELANHQDAQGYTPLIYAAAGGHVEVAQFLLSQGANPALRGWNGGAPLDFALQSKHDKLAAVLIAHGVDVNTSVAGGSTPLTTVAGTDRIDMVRLLVQSGADVNGLDGRGQSPLFRAVTAGAPEVFNFLLEAGAMPEREGFTLMRVAVERPDVAFLAGLHKMGLSIDVADESGLTPLCYAAMLGRLTAVEYLLDNGADVNQSVVGFGNALHIAVLFGQTDAANLLIAREAKPVEIATSVDDMFASGRAMHWYANRVHAAGREEEAKRLYFRAAQLYADTQVRANEQIAVEREAGRENLASALEIPAHGSFGLINAGLLAVENAQFGTSGALLNLYRHYSGARDSLSVSHEILMQRYGTMAEESMRSEAQCRQLAAGIATESR